MDQWVQKSQHWVNTTYAGVSGYTPVAEDGIASWATMYALTRGLQHELGITTLSDNFGATTLSYLSSQFPLISSDTGSAHPHIAALVQCAMWCHGYWGGTTFGTWDPDTITHLSQFNSDAGLGSGTALMPKAFKALLTMDPYVAVNGGSADIREVQQWLNGRYIDRRDFSIIPCDGHFSRGVQQGLVYAIQYEIGMADGTANGNLGPATKAGLQSQGTFGPGTIDGAHHLVRLFQGALRFNGYSVPFDGDFGSSTSSVTSSFQSFTRLPTTGASDYPTWASLLISTGDPDRAVSAADMSTPLTASTAVSLYAAGYRSVGRYLNGTGKGIQPGELGHIGAAGLKMFPIYQEFNNDAQYFSQSIGRTQGAAAVLRARQLGITESATIYFPVDFDPTDDEITAVVIPYFQGVSEGVSTSTAVSFAIGVYGTRNVCSRVTAAGLAVSSFIAAMSTGWSGNLGFVLPSNWAYQQIKNLTTSYGLEIDNDVQAPGAPAISGTDIVGTPEPLVNGVATFDSYFWWWVSLDVAAEAARGGGGLRSYEIITVWMVELVPQYTDAEFSVFLGLPPAGDPVRERFAASASLVTTTYAYSHMAVVLRANGMWGLPIGSATGGVADTGGWAFDLATLWSLYVDARRAGTYSQGVRQWMYDYVGNSENFGLTDFTADVDGFNISYALSQNGDRLLSDVVRSQQIACQADPTWRWSQWFDVRFGGSQAVAKAATIDAMTSPAAWQKLTWVGRFHDLRHPGDHTDDADPTGAELAAEASELAEGFVAKLMVLVTDPDPAFVSN